MLETKQLSENSVIVFNDSLCFTVESSNTPESIFVSSDIDIDEDSPYTEEEIENLEKQAITLVRERKLFDQYYYGGLEDDSECVLCGSKSEYWNYKPSFQN